MKKRSVKKPTDGLKGAGQKLTALSKQIESVLRAEVTIFVADEERNMLNTLAAVVRTYNSMQPGDDIETEDFHRSIRVIQRIISHRIAQRVDEELFEG